MTDFTEPAALRDAYAGARQRVLALVAADDGDRWKLAAPACPGWTAHGVLSHLAALASDIIDGKLSGPPDDEWTAGQVADRRDTPTSEVAEEWATAGPQIDELIEAMGMPVFRIAIDALTHEGDIRGALGDARPPTDAVEFLHHFGEMGFSMRITEAGLPALKVIADGHTAVAGQGEPAVTVEAGRYDLSRAYIGRRSASQVREFTWTGDPTPYVSIFGAFDLAANPIVD